MSVHLPQITPVGHVVLDRGVAESIIDHVKNRVSPQALLSGVLHAATQSVPLVRRAMTISVRFHGREDVADVLARCLSTPEATGKTFEVLSLPGLDKVQYAVTNNLGKCLTGLPLVICEQLCFHGRGCFRHHIFVLQAFSNGTPPTLVVAKQYAHGVGTSIMLQLCIGHQLSHCIENQT